MSLRESAMESLSEARAEQAEKEEARRAKEWADLEADIARWTAEAELYWGMAPDVVQRLLKCNWDALAEDGVDEVSDVLVILAYGDPTQGGDKLVCLHPYDAREWREGQKGCGHKEQVTHFSLAWKCPRCGGAVIQEKGYILDLADLGEKLEMLGRGELKACEHDCVPDSVLQVQKAKAEPEGWVRIRVDSATWQMVKALRRMIGYAEGV